MYDAGIVQQYHFLLAYYAAWRQHNPHNAEKPEGPDIARIEAVAGQFRQVASNSSNDQAALQLVMLLMWLWFYAKSSAKTGDGRPVSRKLTWGPILEPVPLNPASHGLLPASAPVLSLCQYDHLPAVADA